MNETEHQCSICHRYLTEEELAINKKHKKRPTEAKCYYCYVDALQKLRQISGEEYPIPKAEDFGRDPTASEQIISSKPSEQPSEETTGWPKETVDEFKKNLGLDLNKPIETNTPKTKPLPNLNMEALKSTKITQISARGVSEDISLVFTVPRELLDPRLQPAIQNGLNNILLSLMNVLTFAPLHNGMMQSILQPPPPNPFGFPNGPPNLWGGGD